MNQKDLAFLTIGSLLHDIGKFGQRGGVLKSREMEKRCCKKGVRIPRSC